MQAVGLRGEELGIPEALRPAHALVLGFRV